VTPESPAARQSRRPDLPPPARALLVVGLLYVFLVGVALLGSGISALGEGFQEQMLASVANPVAGLFAGLLATVLVQSSSVSTSTIVGLVGAGTLPVSLAVPMIMGANIGTTVTSTLAALGSIRRSEEFRRGFAAATVHDFFNLLAVFILLPLELATGFLSGVAGQMTEWIRGAEMAGATMGKSPIRVAVDLPVGWVEGLLGNGTLAGVLFFAIGLGLIFLALGLITHHMRRLVAGSVERAMNRLVGRGGGAVGILVGIAITVAVQSSTITTSILVPLVAGGILSLPNAYPITVGANVGTTITALLASLAVARPEGLTIALVHLLFNLSAMAIIFPVRQIRLIPVRLAEGLAEQAVKRHVVVLAYVLGLFVLLPLTGMLLL
jgi:solute carrier family 34 (sodium-dependent phosphate cotransporter)